MFGKETEKRDNIQADKLSVDNCKCLKGILAILILIYHLYQHTGLYSDTFIGCGLRALGCWCVGVFFFLSGYGLLKSLNEKGKDYIINLPMHRILPFYLLIILLTVIYSSENYFLNGTLDLKTIICSFTFGDTIIGKGWYLQVQLLLYIMFYITIMFLGRKNLIPIFSLEVTIYFIISFSIKMPLWWYAAVPSFVVGMMWCTWKEKIERCFSSVKKWMLCTSISLISFIIFYLGYGIAGFSNINNVALKALFLCLSTKMFAVTVISLLYSG